MRRITAIVIAATAVGSLFPVTPAGAAATHPLGIDVSHFQGTVDWEAVEADGYRFAFAKATEGNTVDDANYSANRTGARSAGLHVGAYHFARPNGATAQELEDDAVAEAEHFLTVAQPAISDLRQVLDMETHNSLSSDDLIAWASTWLSEVEDALGVEPIIYTFPSFWSDHMADTTTFASSGHPLWLAHYTSANSPSVPAEDWGGRGWTLWQWTDSASVDGIAGDVDEDRYNGGRIADLKIDPSVAAPEVLTPSRSMTTRRSFQVSWTGSDPNGIEGYDVRYRRAGIRSGFGEFKRMASDTLATEERLSADPASTYCFSARAYDGAGNRSRWGAERCIVTAADDRTFGRSARWQRERDGDHYLGTYTTTKRKGASLRIRDLKARRLAIVADVCRRCGSVALLWNGDVIARIDLRRAGRDIGRILGRSTLGRVRRGTLEVVVTSRDRRVTIDGVIIGR